MSKSSRVTFRDRPVEQVTSASGAMAAHSETLTVDTESRFELADITDRLVEVLAK